MLNVNQFKSLQQLNGSVWWSVFLQTKKSHLSDSAPVKGDEQKKESQRLAEFRKKLRETTPLNDLGEQPLTPPAVKEDPLPAWPNNKNPHTGEMNGPRGPEPTRYGDWERKGRVSDF